MADDSPIGGLLDALDARATTTIEGTTAHWKCRTLSPTEAVELGVAFGMLQAAIKVEDGPARPLPDSVKVEALRHMQSVACAVVIEASVSGKEWAPIRLVSRIEDHSKTATPPRIYIGAIDPGDIATIAAAATAGYREARARTAGFPAGPDAPAGAGRDGAQVRTPPGAGGSERSAGA